MFGIQQFDVDMYAAIMRHGLTVDSFIALKRDNQLPPDLKAAWDDYDAKLKAWRASGENEE